MNKLLNKIKYQFERYIDVKDINEEQLKDLIKKENVLIDVRSPQEYNEGHLDGAICIPEYEIEKEIKNQVEDKQKIIILYCDSGGRSKKAQKKLEKLGYSNVYNLYKGISK